MNSFLEKHLGGGGAEGKRAFSPSVWMIVFVVVLAFGAYMLFGRKGKPGHASAGGPPMGGGGRGGRQGVNTYGRAGATNMMQQIYEDKENFVQPPPRYGDSDSSIDISGGGGGVGGGGGGGGAGPMAQFASVAGGGDGGGGMGGGGGAAMDPSQAQLQVQGQMDNAGMPTLSRTDARAIDFAALRDQYGKGKKGPR
jgi:hypothetical protein